MAPEGRVSTHFILRLRLSTEHHYAFKPSPCLKRVELPLNEQIFNTIGIRQAAAKQEFDTIEGGYGTTELFVQADLVRKVLAKQSVDYVIANAVAATFAARFLDGRRNQTGKVIAFYSNAQTIELVQKKQLLATVSDSPVLQARIAIDLAVRALEGAPYPRRVSPVIKVISQDNIHQIDLEQILAPENQWMIHQDLPSLNGAR
ncbi:hypothetical protein [Shewanella baltica]|uniref:hypothetical protein n=1 Tax=Shewanella baltica TaxID=62322 RepID=UPI0039B062BD